MEKKKITQKLAAYSSLTAGIFLLGNVSADAQIVYTDIADINVNLNSGLHLIDINNDGVNDVSLKADQQTYTSSYSTSTSSSSKAGYQTQVKAAKVIPLNANDLGVNSSSAIIISPFNQGDTINQTNVFWQSLTSSYAPFSYRALRAEIRYGSSLSNYTYAYGWNNGTTAYAALKFDISGTDHYAWLRFRVDSALAFTLLDYAYESTGDSIIVGETGVSINEYQQLNADVFAYGDAIKINNAENANYYIYNLSGQIISEGLIPNNNYSLKLENKGVFVVRLTKDNKQFTKKVVL